MMEMYKYGDTSLCTIRIFPSLLVTLIAVELQSVMLHQTRL